MKLLFQALFYGLLIITNFGFTISPTAKECIAGIAVSKEDGGREHYNKILPKGTSVSRINIYHGRLIDGFEIFFYDQAGNTSSFLIGNKTGSNRDIFTPNDNVSIIGISGRHGRVIDTIMFHFSDGSFSNLYGGEDKKKGKEEVGRKGYEIIIPPAYQNGEQNIKFYGKFGRVIDSIGIKYDC